MNRIIGIGVLVLLFGAGMAHAGVEVTLKSYQKARKNGKIVWVKAKKVVPGTTIRYVNVIRNRESESIRNLELRNDIPEHMRYIAGSVRCKKACRYLFSVDEGRHFAKPGKLMVRDKMTGKIRRAKPSEYTTVKWIIETLRPGEKTMVTYKAKLL